MLLAFCTLSMMAFINLDLAVRFQFWLLNMLRRIESKLNDLEKDDD